MKDLDFLPTRYRRDRSAHAGLVWRVGIALAYAGVLASLCGWQLAQRRQLTSDVAQASKQYDLMLAHANRCAELESQLRVVESEARLWTYLRHPWSRTQVLAALAAPLPPTIVLEELNIVRSEPPATDAAALRRDRTRTAQEGEPKQDNRPLAERDLDTLRAACDEAPIIVTIEGATQDIGQLHAYLGQLRQHPLFSRVELVSAESREALGRPELQFTARMTLRPGYGQPAGPASPIANSPHSSIQRT